MVDPSPADHPASPTNRRSRIWAALTGRAGLRAIGSAAIVLVALFFPRFTTVLIFELAAIALVVFGLHGAWLSVRASPTLWVELGRDLLIVLAGVAILVLRAVDRGGAIVAALALVLGIRGLVQGLGVLRNPDRRRQVWPYIPPMGQLVVGGLLVVAPESLAAIALGAALFWMASGAINLSRALSDPDADPASLAETGSAVIDYLQNQDVGNETRAEVEEALFFENPAGVLEGTQLQASAARVWRFVALMSFSTAIATFGISADSTAVVIGAMLVAPLMTPILGVSASIVGGWSYRLVRSLAIVAVGVGVAIVLSFLLTKYVASFIDVASNTQVQSRVSPNLIDLAIAIAAGAAGAFANARRDVADSLPGVAIAVALVPPLSVVGVTLQEGALDLALGAFLLFGTNLVGIIVAAAVTFFLLGLTPWFRIEAEAKSIGRSFATAALALVLIAIPLAVSGEDLIRSATNQAAVNQLVNTALEDTPYSPARVELRGDEIEIVVTGPPDAPAFDLDGLAAEIGSVLKRDFTLTVRVLPEVVLVLEVSEA